MTQLISPPVEAKRGIVSDGRFPELLAAIHEEYGGASSLLNALCTGGIGGSPAKDSGEPAVADMSVSAAIPVDVFHAAGGTSGADFPDSGYHQQADVEFQKGGPSIAIEAGLPVSGALPGMPGIAWASPVKDPMVSMPERVPVTGDPIHPLQPALSDEDPLRAATGLSSEGQGRAQGASRAEAVERDGSRKAAGVVRGVTEGVAGEASAGVIERGVRAAVRRDVSADSDQGVIGKAVEGQVGSGASERLRQTPHQVGVDGRVSSEEGQARGVSARAGDDAGASFAVNQGEFDNTVDGRYQPFPQQPAVAQNLQPAARYAVAPLPFRDIGDVPLLSTRTVPLDGGGCMEFSVKAGQLGMIDVEVTVHGRSVSAQIDASSAQTRDLIAGSMQSLLSDLARSGLMIGNVTVNLRNNGGSPEGRPNAGVGQRDSGATEDRKEGESRRVVRPAGLLSIYV